MLQISDTTGLILAVVALGLLPFVAMVVTSYAKIVVVLGLLRNALGVQQVPPNMVINGIAILVSVYVMAPIGMSASKSLENQQISPQSSQAMLQIFAAARGPFHTFLEKNTQEREKLFFL